MKECAACEGDAQPRKRRRMEEDDSEQQQQEQQEQQEQQQQQEQQEQQQQQEQEEIEQQQQEQEEQQEVQQQLQLKESKEVVPLNTWVLISNLKLSYNLVRNPDGSFNRELAEFLERKVPDGTAPDGVTAMDMRINRAVWARIFLPPPESPAAGGGAAGATSPSIPIFFYFHGGSFAHSSANSALYNTVCLHLARICNVIVVSVNYRRSPEHRYPAPYDDGVAAVTWLAAQYRSGATWLPAGADPNRCFLVGDSNGGNIAHHVAVRLAAAVKVSQREVSGGQLSAADVAPLRMAGQILIIPMFGGAPRTPSENRYDGQYFVTIKDRDFYWQLFLPPGSDRDHPACRIFGPNSAPLDDVELPPTLLAVAELDMMLDWQLDYCDGMRRAGKRVSKLFLREATVGFFIFPNTNHFHRLMNAIRQFVHSPSSVADDVHC